MFHGSNLDRQRDKAKWVAMEAAGWTFLEVWDSEVWRNPSAVVQRIESARRDLRKMVVPATKIRTGCGWVRWGCEFVGPGQERAETASMISVTGRKVRPAVERCAYRTMPAASTTKIERR